MKKKFDFVTNSSSTSFILGCKEKIEGLSKGSGLSDLINSIIDLTIATTEEELEGIRDNYGFEKTDNQYIKWVNVINNGGSVIYISIPYGGEVANINSFIKKYKAEILMDDC